jgi:hypothetical protein
MADHLSALELDVMLTGGSLAPERASHASECADCKQRVDRERTAADAIRSRPEFGATLAKLTAEPQVGAKVFSLRRRAPVIFTLALAAAAAFVFLINPPKEDDTRIKGVASVELISDTNQVVHAAHVGDRLQLALGAAGRPFAMVFAVDDKGQIDALWPAGQRSGPAPKGARTVVTRLEVTEGSLTLVALYSDQPLDVPEASKALSGALREGKVPVPLELTGLTTAVSRLEVNK